MVFSNVVANGVAGSGRVMKLALAACAALASGACGDTQPPATLFCLELFPWGGATKDRITFQLSPDNSTIVTAVRDRITDNPEYDRQIGLDPDPKLIFSNVPITTERDLLSWFVKYMGDNKPDRYVLDRTTLSLLLIQASDGKSVNYRCVMRRRAI